MTSMTEGPTSTTSCPAWCEEHVLDEVPGEETLHRHRSLTLTSSGAHLGAGPAAAPQDVRVWANQFAFDDGEAEPAFVLLEVPTEQDTAQLTAAQARALADSLLEAAHQLDGLGRTNSLHPCRCDACSCE